MRRPISSSDELYGARRGGAGLSISISTTTTNQGPGNAVASTLRFYLSGDALLDANDTPIGTRGRARAQCRHVVHGDIAVDVPVNTPPGLYYVFDKADADDVVNETSESTTGPCASCSSGPILRDGAERAGGGLAGIRRRRVRAPSTIAAAAAPARPRRATTSRPTCS